MAQGKKSFILYCDQRDIFEQLTFEQAGKLIMHIFQYVNDEDPKSEDPFTNIAFASIKNTLKRDLDKWEKQHQQRIEAGKKSAESRKRNATTVNERSISSTVSVNVSDSVNVNGNDINISFFHFWDKYDKKNNKASCEKKWKKLKDSEREQIMLHLEDYINSTPDKQYRKNPDTYLNQRHWENEIETEKKVTSVKDFPNNAFLFQS